MKCFSTLSDIQFDLISNLIKCLEKNSLVSSCLKIKFQDMISSLQDQKRLLDGKENSLNSKRSKYSVFVFFSKLGPIYCNHRQKLFVAELPNDSVHSPKKILGL